MNFYKKLMFFLLLLLLPEVSTKTEADERNEYAWSLIQEIYNNYPEYIPKLLQYDSEVTNFNLLNETYKGFIRQMRRNNKYEILVADAYTYNFKNNIFESGKRPNTVLYQCEKAIRYCSGNPTYCEYHEGSPGSNIILISGHDGELKPSSIPDRDAGCLINNNCVFKHDCENKKNGTRKNFTACATKDKRDLYSTAITELLSKEIDRLTGETPHVIINNIHRSKVDMNRKKPLATFDVPETNQAWDDFHELIKTAKNNLNGKRGLLLDIHGNAQSAHWNMFGYGIDTHHLNNEITYPNQTTIRSLGDYVKVKFDQLLRGSNSLGHIMEVKGYKSVPSKMNRHPKDRPYFIGDHIIFNHGSMYQGNVDAVLVEIYSKYRTKNAYKSFTRDLAKSVIEYMQLNYENKGLIY